MTVHMIFWLAMAALVFIGGPIAMVMTIIEGMRRKGSDRPSGGGISSGVAGAMMEIDRLIARPSIEHQIETEHPVLQREDDKGGD